MSAASCRTGKFTDRATKQSSCARSCSASNCSASASPSTVTDRVQHDLVEAAAAVAFDGQPADGGVGVGDDPHAGDGGQVQELQHVALREGGDQQLLGVPAAASPRNAGSDEPAMPCLPGAVTSLSRP